MHLHKHVYNRNEAAGPWWKTAQWSLGATIRGKYHGTLLKGWWQIGRSSITNYLEIEAALGGEDSMVQFGIVLPFLGRWHMGVQVPRSWTRGWIYHRREWTLRVGYVGRWAELLIASDEHMRDTGMVSYYREMRKRGEESHTARAQEWPGWHLTLQPHLRDRVLGRTICTTTEDPPEPVIVPMPEGNYPGTMKREHRVWKRKRWPWPSQKRSEYWIDMQIGIPTPGKGENSWDIDDDAIHGTGGGTPAEAIMNVSKAALRQRERYASRDWVPSDGWPEGVGVRAA